MAHDATNGTSTSGDQPDSGKASPEDLRAIEELVGDLERRLRRLNIAVKRQAAGGPNDVSDFVSETLDDVSERLRESVRKLAQSVSDEAVRAGADTLNRIAHEVDHRPFALLAAAVGVGFLLGLAIRHR